MSNTQIRDYAFGNCVFYPRRKIEEWHLFTRGFEEEYLQGLKFENKSKVVRLCVMSYSCLKLALQILGRQCKRNGLKLG